MTEQKKIQDGYYIDKNDKENIEALKNLNILKNERINKMNKYSLITKKIQEAVPEIMELKFGCKVEYKHKQDESTKVDTIIKIDYGAEFNSFRTINGYIQSEEVITKTIGKDITLEDCMIASPIGILVDRNGIFYNTKLKALNIGRAWILNTPYHLQSQSTKDFIGNLLT